MNRMKEADTDTSLSEKKVVDVSDKNELMQLSWESVTVEFRNTEMSTIVYISESDVSSQL